MRNFKFFACCALVLMSSCDKESTGPDPVQPGDFMPISEFRALYTSTGDLQVPAGTRKISGVVISNSFNESVGNYRVQDASGAGIYLNMIAGSPDYPLGTVLEIDAAGEGVLSKFNGDLQLRNVPSSKVKMVSGNWTIIPRETNTQEIITNIQTWSSTLATLNDVNILKEGVPDSLGQYYRITDSAGSILSYVRSASGIVLVEGDAGSITGYVSIYQPGTNPPLIMLTLRSEEDIENGAQGGPDQSGIDLGITSPYVIDFNNIGSGLPQGVSVVMGAGDSSSGTQGIYYSMPGESLWNDTIAGFRNYASATGLDMGIDSTTQVGATNRSLGVRQDSLPGFDPGAAFVFELQNTIGKNDLKLDFILQSLDTSSHLTRTTTWMVDYALGDVPIAFIPFTPTGILTTGNMAFSNNPVSVIFPAELNDQMQKVWIRIVALTPATGTGGWAATGIDDAVFSWN